MAAIQTNNLSKRLGERWVLTRLSFSVPNGQTVLLSGSNGAGKTTLLKVLSTSLRPSYGTLELLGRPLNDIAAIRRHVGLLTHNTHLYEGLSAAENLQLAQHFLGADVAMETGACLERVGLAHVAQREVRAFSAGMRRRLALARLLLKQPRLALLDEPFSQLDPEGIALMEDVLAELRRAGTTVVLSTHDIERGLRLADARLHLDRGILTAPLPQSASPRETD